MFICASSTYPEPIDGLPTWDSFVRNDIQDDEEGGHDKECKKCGEEDWRIEVEDNVECDGIDDTLSDNEDEPQRNRQRMTL